MVLGMVRPYKHPKTGTYWVRKVVPANLRKSVGKRELKASLCTKDPQEARAKAPVVLQRFDAILAGAHGDAPQLTERDIASLAGEWYRAETAFYGANPDEPEGWNLYIDDVASRYEDQEPDEDPRLARVFLKPQDRAEAAELLEKHGHIADPATVTRLAEALLPVKLAFAREMLKRAGGDWSPDVTLARFPPLEPRKAPEATPARITVGALIAAWAAETETTGKALYDRERTGKLLTDFLGHDDAARVTPEDVIDWKEKRLAAGRSKKTVANDIGELRPIWTWGKKNRKLTFVENPFAGAAPAIKRRGKRMRGPYTDEEAIKLLEAARGEREASLRWLPWVLCFTGARLGEVTQAIKEDVYQHVKEGDEPNKDADPWILRIHGDGPGRTLKTAQSERMVPLHPALTTEGFLRHVQSLPAHSPLFRDLRPDSFGMLKGTATKKHGRWVRRVVGITDKTKDPAHAWRHRFEDEARRAGLPQNVTDALLGHLNPINESEGYGRGFRFMPEVTAPWVAKMRAPTVPIPPGGLHELAVQDGGIDVVIPNRSRSRAY